MSYKDKKNDLLKKGKEMFGTFALRWNHPAKGDYVSNKEILNYSVQGMGRDMLLMLVKYLGMGLGNMLFGSVLGIRPMHIQTMNTILLVLDIFFVGLRARIVDNTNTKWGRFKPYVFLIPIPLFLIATTFLCLPLETMQYSTKIITTFCFALAVMIVRPYYDGSVTNLGNVITPNTKERTKVLAVFSIIYSTAPTIYGFVIPILSDLTGGYTDIRTYRYIMIPVAFLGVILSMISVVDCKERFISPKSYKPKAKLFRTTIEVFKNKYWWIRTLSGWLAFMEWSVGNIFLWSFVYGSQNMASYAVFNFFVGESALIAMLITPYLLGRFGNRKLIVFQNVFNIVFLGMVALTFKNQYIFFIFWFLNSFVNYFATVYGPVFSAEVNDYQQYISGKRVDGVMSFASLIGLPITITTGYFAPAIFEAVGITTNYDILFEPMVRNNVFTVLCICGIIGAVLNLAPLLFYDYSHSKHRNVVRILRYRAMLADYVSGDITSQVIVDGINGYNEYNEIINAEMPILKNSRRKIKEAKALPKSNEEEKKIRKSAIKASKKAFFADKTLIEEKKISNMYYNELNKYNNENELKKIDIARALSDKDISQLYLLDEDKLAEVQRAIENNNDEQNFSKLLINDAKKQLKMAKRIIKAYPSGIVEPDKQAYVDAQALPHGNKEENNIRYAAIKKASQEQKQFNNVLYYYLESKRFVVEYDSRIHFEVIESMYDEAKADLERIYNANMEKERIEKEENQAELEKLKKKRKDDKMNRKNKKANNNHDDESTDSKGDNSNE